MLEKLILCGLVAVIFCSVFPTKQDVTMEVAVADVCSVTETTTTVTETTTETTTEPPRNIMTVIATAYCPCEKCCGKWADGITASGKKARANHTIAVDKRVIPLGTTVIINGQEYVAEDTGGAIKGNRVDIYFDSHSEALKFGRQTIEIEVLL